MRCCIDGCHYTTSKYDDVQGQFEWMCGRHWQNIPKRMKAVHRRATKHGPELRRVRLWKRLKREAWVRGHKPRR